MVPMRFTPRKIGWGITVFSYALAFLHWDFIDGSKPISDIIFFAIIIFAFIDIVLAFKFKYYDLFAAATFTLTSILVVFWWQGPFFSVR